MDPREKDIFAFQEPCRFRLSDSRKSPAGGGSGAPPVAVALYGRRPRPPPPRNLVEDAAASAWAPGDLQRQRALFGLAPARALQVPPSAAKQSRSLRALGALCLDMPGHDVQAAAALEAAAWQSVD